MYCVGMQWCTAMKKNMDMVIARWWSIHTVVCFNTFKIWFWNMKACVCFWKNVFRGSPVCVALHCLYSMTRPTLEKIIRKKFPLEFFFKNSGFSPLKIPGLLFILATCPTSAWFIFSFITMYNLPTKQNVWIIKCNSFIHNKKIQVKWTICTRKNEGRENCVLFSKKKIFFLRILMKFE